VYDDTGALLRTVDVSSDEEFSELLRNTSYQNHGESTWNDEQNTSVIDAGNGITVTVHYDEDSLKESAVLEQNGTVKAESSYMMVRPFMVDESDEDFVPCGWWVVTMNNNREDDKGEIVYDDAGFVITDRDGNIVYREEGSSYSVALVDENFCVLTDWNSGKYMIKDYSGRELFSWIMPEQIEYW
jgi:hypothetical protein